ncbi:MAG: phospholipase D-like domain-containing protein [Formivibrio sp.]|nr:phospholipase D-like domain-containing protein [Formivibrio sp.]
MSYSSTPTFDYEMPTKTIRQIYVKDTLEPCKAQGSGNIDLAYEQVFSDPVGGNTVTFLTTGKAYFAELITAIRDAKEEVLIAGWQINWDAQLAIGMRLYDLLLEVARKADGPKIYVMPWDNSSQVETYAKQTEKVLLDINTIVGKKKIFVYRSPSLSDEDQLFFSHHQKQVVIDRKIGFIGGIDIAYGRYDDATFTLKADADGRDGLNRYNSCIPAIGSMVHPNIDPDLLNGWYDNSIGGAAKKTRQTIADGGLQGVSGGTPTTTLDPTRQPRMPWQDLQQKIDGPAAINLALNFALRWNVGASPKLKVPALAVKPAPGDSGCSVQVLRSASAALRDKEFSACLGETKKNAFPYYTPSGKQDDILRAMYQLIEQAQHYIYIENQFFTSAFGDAVPPNIDERLSGPARIVKAGNAWSVRATRIMPGDADGPIKNEICKKLGERLWRAITEGKREPFHVYIVLPVHPEGHLNDGPTMTQIHWTMQSLVFGTHSLLARVKDALRQVNRPESEWTQYLTLLNLRNWAKLTDANGNTSVVTEQIYVHTKLMIVDDRFVLHGSANINDRSQLGSRDSEIAVLIHDSADSLADLCGTGDQLLKLKHASKLRKAIWRKLFGLDQQQCQSTGGAGPASALEAMLDQPAAPATVAAIQDIASNNQAIYKAVFKWIPQDQILFSGEKEPVLASIWPLWKKKLDENGNEISGALVGEMPFDEPFWTHPQVPASAATQLSAIQGFITALPINWTAKENNNIGYHERLVAENNLPNAKHNDANVLTASATTENDRTGPSKG